MEQVSKAHGLRLNVEEGDTVSGVFHLKATADQKKHKINDRWKTNSTSIPCT